jgi:hypothetical protein
LNKENKDYGLKALLFYFHNSSKESLFESESSISASVSENCYGISGEVTGEPSTIRSDISS